MGIKSKSKGKRKQKYSKNHKHSVHHRVSRRRYNHSHSKHHIPSNKTRRHRRSREVSFVSIPGSKAVALFSATNKKRSELIRVEEGDNQSMGNIIPGLRNYLKNI